MRHPLWRGKAGSPAGGSFHQGTGVGGQDLFPRADGQKRIRVPVPGEHPLNQGEVGFGLEKVPAVPFGGGLCFY